MKFVSFTIHDGQTMAMDEQGDIYGPVKYERVQFGKGILDVPNGSEWVRLRDGECVNLIHGELVYANT